MTLASDHILDCVGLHCPMPIAKLSKRIKELEPGEVLEVLADDPDFESDLEAWCRLTGNQCLGVEERDGETHAFVRRT